MYKGCRPSSFTGSAGEPARRGYGPQRVDPMMIRRIVLLVCLLVCVVPTTALALDLEGPDVVGSNLGSGLSCDDATAVGDAALIAQRGCCSWHSGVCGCYGIRVVCFDGQLSPSCTCRD